MGNVIVLSEYKKNKDEEKLSREARECSIKDRIKDSLDNDLVKKEYKIKGKKETLEERGRRLMESIQRINRLMAELEKETKK